jgi:hypothetical protein
MQATTRITTGTGIALQRAEIILSAMVVAIGLAAVVNAALRDQAVAWAAFAPALAASAALVALGGWMRAQRAMHRMALASIGTGVFMGFAGVSAIFIYTLFPLHNTVIDPILMRWDAAVGYVWLDVVTWLADHAPVGQVLGLIYHSSLVQILGLIVMLAALDRGQALHRFLATGIIGMAVTVAIWWTIPSIGTAPHALVPEDVAARSGLFSDAAMGAFLRQLADHGAAVVTPEVITGVISFPSFHMFMALMCLWFARGTWLWPLYLPLNAAMVPATLVHGGHHLIDLAAALVLFVLCTRVAARVAH